MRTPVEVFEDSFELPTLLVEPGPPTCASYPYPSLAATDRNSTLRLSVLSIQNDFLRVDVCPDLGGRIVSFVDRASGQNLLPAEVEGLRKGGERGVELRQGIQFRSRGKDRPNATGRVSAAAMPPSSEGASGQIVLGEAVGNRGLASHVFLRLRADSPTLHWELRLFNRTSEPVPATAGMCAYFGNGDAYAGAGSVGFYDRERDVGCIAHVGPPLGGAARWDGKELVIDQMERLGWLAPHQTVTFHVRITPVQGLGGIEVIGEEAVANRRPESLRIFALGPASGGRVRLATTGNEVYEAPWNPEAGQLVALPLDRLGAPVQRYEVICASGTLSAVERLPVRDHALPEALPRPVIPEGPEAALDVAGRAHAYYRSSLSHLAQGDWAAAEADLEQSLLYNGDDPVAWWLKARAVHFMSSGPDEAPELLNAHYLAPLDPLLRAASFLAADVKSKDPSPLLAPLAEAPETFVDVAALLVEAGLYADALRFLDDALRHRDRAMLRLLLAYCLLEGSRMDAEAATHVAAADRLPLEPPFPWRPVELLALRRIDARFPTSKASAALLRQVAECQGPSAAVPESASTAF